MASTTKQQHRVKKSTSAISALWATGSFVFVFFWLFNLSFPSLFISFHTHTLTHNKHTHTHTHKYRNIHYMQQQHPLHQRLRVLETKRWTQKVDFLVLVFFLFFFFWVEIEEGSRAQSMPSRFRCCRLRFDLTSNKFEVWICRTCHVSTNSFDLPESIELFCSSKYCGGWSCS